MKKIKDGIVFSYDIKRILEGYNALNFNYSKEGMMIPDDGYLNNIRYDFSKDTSRIFRGKSTIVSEDDMLEYLDTAISDVYGRYPHCIA